MGTCSYLGVARIPNTVVKERTIECFSPSQTSKGDNIRISQQRKGGKEILIIAPKSNVLYMHTYLLSCLAQLEKQLNIRKTIDMVYLLQ